MTHPDDPSSARLRAAHGASLWLLPELRASTAFSAAIQAINAVRGAPEFAPHLTVTSVPPLAGKSRVSDDELAVVAALVAAATGPIVLKRAPVVRGKGFTKALTLPFSAEIDDGPALLRLRRLARGALQLGPDETPFQPHVSLAYGEDALPATLSAQSHLHGLQDRVVFDRICVLRTIWPITSQDEVRQWRLSPPLRLAGAPPR